MVSKNVYVSIVKIYMLPFKSLGLVRFFNCFFLFKVFCSPKLQLFDQEYSKYCNIVKYYYNLK